MSYRTYTTQALVCRSYDRNQSDRTYRLFTRSFGLLFATARSVREERSRQRYALQDFSCIHASLVRGRSGWRIGSVIDIDNPFLRADTQHERIAIVRVVRLVNRYIHGEGESRELYDILQEAIRALGAGAVNHPDAYSRGVELQLLYQLGYIAPAAKWQEWVRAPLDAFDHEWDAQLTAAVQSMVRTAADVSQL